MTKYYVIGPTLHKKRIFRYPLESLIFQWQQVKPTATSKLNTQNNRIVSHEKISHLLCYAVVNVCKFCTYCWLHKCPTEVFQLHLPLESCCTN